MQSLVYRLPLTSDLKHENVTLKKNQFESFPHRYNYIFDWSHTQNFTF